MDNSTKVSSSDETCVLLFLSLSCYCYTHAVFCSCISYRWTIIYGVVNLVKLVCHVLRSFVYSIQPLLLVANVRVCAVRNAKGT